MCRELHIAEFTDSQHRNVIRAPDDPKFSLRHGPTPRRRLSLLLFSCEAQRPFLGPRGHGQELPEPFCVLLGIGLRASCYPCPEFTPSAPMFKAINFQTAPLPRSRLICPIRTKISVTAVLSREPCPFTIFWRLQTSCIGEEVGHENVEGTARFPHHISHSSPARQVFVKIWTFR
jgi:hypothetical protein